MNIFRNFIIMKTISFFLVFWIVQSLFNLQALAQENLVPNPSFEDTLGCPDSEDQIHYAEGWIKYSLSTSTPDYYNACANPAFYGVPNCGGGYQQSKSGNAHAAVATFAGPISDYREHIGIQLTSTLVIGHKYFVSFYTVMAEAFGFGTPSNNIGVRLSTVPYSGNNPVPIDNFAHVHSSTIINDTINWIRVSGSIIADSAYKYVIVGNFFDDANTDTLTYDSLSNQSYYYIDDICVSTDSLCNVSTTIYDKRAHNKFHVFPNPVDDHLTIQAINPLQISRSINAKIFDKSGRVLFQEDLSHDQLTFNLSSINPGFYILRIQGEGPGLLYTCKIVKL